MNADYFQVDNNINEIVYTCCYQSERESRIFLSTNQPNNNVNHNITILNDQFKPGLNRRFSQLSFWKY